MTANQLVAYNLRRARVLRELTQEQAAEKLEPHLGVRWSKATFSAAETSVTSERVRQFTADEVLAFAAAFDLPIAYFFVPPTEPTIREPVTMGGNASLDVTALLDAAVPAETDELHARLAELLRALSKKESPDWAKRLNHLAVSRVAAALAQSLGDIQTEAAHLRRVATILEKATGKALEQFAGDLLPRSEDPLTVARRQALKRYEAKAREEDR